jgi:hypothetical protein
MQHQMIRTGSGQGTEEWSCTQCARRILLRRPPAFAKIVLDRGDETAGHAGGGSSVTVSLATAPALAAEITDDQRSWLADHGIAWEEDSGDQ